MLPALGLVFGMSAAGCSMSYQIGSVLGKDRDKAEHVASVTNASRKASADTMSELDLALASAAAADVLAKGSADASVPWENPRSGARGTVTPIAAAYTMDGFMCRDFLASYVLDNSESWLQGEACRVNRGKWVVRRLTPWKRV